MLIAMEGLDQSGKATQSQLLRDQLRQGDPHSFRLRVVGDRLHWPPAPHSRWSAVIRCQNTGDGVRFRASH